MFCAKLKAMFLHGVITLIVAMLVWLLVFCLWYPQIYSEVMSGTKLFLLILLVEVILGPFVSLVIYNPNKTKRELLFDYCCVGSVQLLALCYGIYSVAISRPVYVVFVKDRLEVVAAYDIEADDLLAANEIRFKSLPWDGPKLVCVRPVDAEEKKALLFSYYPRGKDVQHLPRFYRDCASGEVYSGAQEITKLHEISINKGVENLLDTIDKKAKVRWIPLHGKQGVWVSFVSSGDNNPAGFLALDPY